MPTKGDLAPLIDNVKIPSEIKPPLTRSQNDKKCCKKCKMRRNYVK